MMKNPELLNKIAAIYNWLDEQIQNNKDFVGRCLACGKCCNFDKFDHRLFITSPELLYFLEKAGQKKLKPLDDGRCPYKTDGKCTVYSYRFAGCRIFFCKADRNFQNELSEDVLKKFKSVCSEFSIEYRYMDIAAAHDFSFSS